MAVLKRKILLTLTAGEGELTLSNLRVDFTVNKYIGLFLNTAEIEVYNLSYDTIKWLGTSEKMQVRLDVGYEGRGSLSTIFTGVLMNIKPIKQYQDHITTLYCWVNGTLELEKKWYKPIRNTTLGLLISELAEEAGYRSVDFTAFPTDEVGTKINTFSQSGTVKEVLNYLGRQYDFLFSVQNGVMKISKTQATLTSINDVILNLPVPRHKVVENFMRKPISFEVGLVDVVYKLNPNIEPSHILEIPVEGDEAVERSVSGVGDLLFFSGGIFQLAIKDFYQIIEVVHTGSNYTDSWDSNIRGYVNSGTRNLK